MRLVHRFSLMIRLQIHILDAEQQWHSNKQAQYGIAVIIHVFLVSSIQDLVQKFLCRPYKLLCHCTMVNRIG